MKRRTRTALVVVFLFVLLWAGYRLFDRLEQAETRLAANQALISALSVALIVLTLALAGILIRNLVKLIVERKRGILGSRLRTKLVFFFLALVLVPAIVLFYGSAQVIKQTVEALLRPPDLTEQAQEIVDHWTGVARDRSLLRARALAREVAARQLLAPDRRADLGALIANQRELEELDVVRLKTAEPGFRTIESLPGEPTVDRVEIRAATEDLLDRVILEGRELTRLDKVGDALLVQAGVTLEAPARGRAGALAVGLLLPAELVVRAEDVVSANEIYRQFRAKRSELVRFYLTLIGFIFLATLFVATWIGFYLARRITGPIQELAAATREISTGNLGVRVKADVGDELAVLVDAFNEMAAELQESREVITRSTADLRRSNQALDERRRYIETLVANLSTAVLSLDPENRVITANPAVQTVLGVRLVAGDDVRRELRRHELVPMADLLDRTLGTVTTRTDLEVSSRGAKLNLSVQVSPLRGRSGEVLGTLVMVEDLSDLLRAQRALAWSEVARRIAHEIKNPLTPIQLAAQRLRKKYRDGAPDVGEVLLESTASIEHEVSGLKQLVDEFSRFARMPEIAPKPVEFRGVIDSVLALYQGVDGIEWNIDLDPDVGWVTVDAQQMRRALINLIDNAVVAVDGRGTIRIVARAEPGEGMLRIEVADSGPGIPVGDRDKMFVPYFSTKKRGTGLGLAIVHKVVTDHHGTIRVEENSPRGARFVIEIPA